MTTDPETLRRAVLDLYERVERLEMRADGLTPMERVSRRWEKEKAADGDKLDRLIAQDAADDDGPAVPESREPASVMQHPTDAELLELMSKSMRDDLAEVSRLAALQAGTEPGVFRISLNYDMVQFARAVLARWVPPGWQPIETAPRDGTEILASDYDPVEILRWEPPRQPGSRGCWTGRNLDPLFRPGSRGYRLPTPQPPMGS